jgi:hypothetical protein
VEPVAPAAALDVPVRYLRLAGDLVAVVALPLGFELHLLLDADGPALAYWYADGADRAGYVLGFAQVGQA